MAIHWLTPQVRISRLAPHGSSEWSKKLKMASNIGVLPVKKRMPSLRNLDDRIHSAKPAAAGQDQNRIGHHAGFAPLPPLRAEGFPFIFTLTWLSKQ